MLPSSANKASPIYKLPLLAKTSYMITSSALVQSCLAKRELSFEPYEIEFSGPMLGLSQSSTEFLKVGMHDPGAKTLLRDVHKSLKISLQDGHLRDMNDSMLQRLALIFNELDHRTVLDSLYIWLRDNMTLATTTSLFGVHNPLKADHSLVETLW